MEEGTKTAVGMLDVQIKELLEDLEIARFSEEQTAPLISKLKALCSQKEVLEKLLLDQQKIDAETALKIKELELKEENDKKMREIEQKKLQESAKSNTVQAIIAGVGTITGIASLIATVFMFKKGLIFEETGSYTVKTVQNLGNIARIVK